MVNPLIVILNPISSINGLQSDTSANCDIKDIAETFSICFSNLAGHFINKFLIL